MEPIVHSLKQNAAFRSSYHAGDGSGLGEKDALSGLAPLSLFLDTLGVHPISAHKVSIQGNNPFPWPVTVKYRGLTISRQKEKTVVIFPDGQTLAITDPAPRIVSLE